MVFAIILAAGEGSRMGLKDKNKTSLKFKDKSLVQYGVDLFEDIADKTFIVVGAYAESVKANVVGEEIYYALQEERNGTGHATLIAVEEIEKNDFTPDVVFIGYGDHLLRYTKEVVKNMYELHKSQSAAVTLLTTEADNPMELAWGRIVRKEDGSVGAIVEQKDATEEQLAIKEVNPGFYCVDYKFLQSALRDLAPSPVSGEYYLTDIVEIAVKEDKKVVAHKVPFEVVGYGINTEHDLEDAKVLDAMS